jgi:hypothetical protein
MNRRGAEDAEGTEKYKEKFENASSILFSLCALCVLCGSYPVSLL